MTDKRGTNEEFIKNQWKENESGNPKGRPKSFLGKFKDEWTKRLFDEYGSAPTRKDINDILLILINVPEKELVEISNNTESAPIYMKIIAGALLSEKAFVSLDNIFDRIYGKPAQQQPDAPTGENVINFTDNRNEPPIL